MLPLDQQNEGMECNGDAHYDQVSGSGQICEMNRDLVQQNVNEQCHPRPIRKPNHASHFTILQDKIKSSKRLQTNYCTEEYQGKEGQNKSCNLLIRRALEVLSNCMAIIPNDSHKENSAKTHLANLSNPKHNPISDPVAQ